LVFLRNQGQIFGDNNQDAVAKSMRG